MTERGPARGALCVSIMDAWFNDFNSVWTRGELGLLISCGCHATGEPALIVSPKRAGWIYIVAQDIVRER